MNLTREEFDKDPRTACKYGVNCYQRSKSHKSKYKHPPQKLCAANNNTEPLAKKAKVDTGETSDVSRENPSQNVQNIKLDTDKDTSNLSLLKDINSSEFIKSKFLVDMPADFYHFWNFCKKLNKTEPSMALQEIGLILVGAFDVLAGKFENTHEKSIEEYILHWRYFYDPPEFQTVIRRNDNSGYHLGYFRDSPEEMPVFLAHNFANTDGKFTVVGDNLFAAVNTFLEFLKSKADPFMKTTVTKYSSLIRKEADTLKLDLSRKTPNINTRNNKISARTFNKLGFIVPYDKKSHVGYRTLTISDTELQVLLAKLGKASGSEKDELMTDLQYVLTNTSIAIDECDFGTGIELGLDILSFDIDILNSIIARLLASCYRLVKKEAFARIIESHMKNRKKHFDLSII